MNDKLRLFFEFRVPLFSYFLWGVAAFVVFLFGYEFQPLHTKVAQFGCIFIFSGLALRMAASMTVKYLGKIKITGVYALCRHPMLLAQFISFIGVNLLVQNPYFTIMACVIFLVNDCFSAKKYDKLLARHYRDIWEIYAQSTNFVIPLTNRVKDVFRKSISVSESNKANNMIVFGAIYLFLVEIAVLNTLSVK